MSNINLVCYNIVFISVIVMLYFSVKVIVRIYNYFNTVFTQYSSNKYITYEESLLISHSKI